VALYPPRLYSGNSIAIEVDLAARAKVVMQEISGIISRNLIERRCFLGRDPKTMPPWGLFFAYRVCEYHMFHSRGDAGQQSEVVESLQEGLRTINVKWKAAGK
jgi:hypothetical protein